MQSFILIHTDPQKRDEYLMTFSKNHAVHPFDITRVAGEISLGVAAIRDMQTQLYLMPLKGKEKIIVLENAQTLTIEAQNALLKVLEEPPRHTIFFSFCKYI